MEGGGEVWRGEGGGVEGGGDSVNSAATVYSYIID